MQIPKDMVMNFVQQQVGGGQAAQADSQLPDQIDPEQHADLLSQVGVNPQELLGHVAGGDGNLADEASGLLSGGGAGGLEGEAESFLGGER